MKNSIVWILWLLGVMLFILSSRNPIYLCIILAGLFILGHHLSKKKKSTNWVLPNLRFLFTMIFLSTMINGLFSHVGDKILFTIPNSWPLIGGNITLEGLVFGAINGLVIGALYILFNVINLALSIKQLTRLIPRAFHPIAMLVTVSLTFFPSIQNRARDIKEAQMIRGNPMKKISDWLPILIPLLVTSLENAFLLAESMTARGFHRHVDFRTPRNLIGLIFGAFAVFSGWILQLYHYPPYISIPLYLIGAGIFFLILISIGKQTKITRYRHEKWQRADIVFIAILILYFVSFGVLKWSNRLISLNYSPYPQLTHPIIQSAGLFLSLLPLLPLFFNRDD